MNRSDKRISPYSQAGDRHSEGDGREPDVKNCNP